MVWKDELPALITYQDLEVKPASAYTRPTGGRTDGRTKALLGGPLYPTETAGRLDLRERLDVPAGMYPGGTGGTTATPRRWWGFLEPTVCVPGSSSSSSLLGRSHCHSHLP